MRLEQIYGIIAKEGFTDIALQEINDYIKDIQNGTEDFPRFNLSEHAGLSKGGAPLIGASIIACYAGASLEASCYAEGREGQSKSRAEISLLDFCRDAACCRSTKQGGPANWDDAIVLHNCLFPETAMKVIGFTRDSDGLMRIVLTQPYVNCLRLATKEEIDNMVCSKGIP